MQARELAPVAVSVALAATGAVVATVGDDARSADPSRDRGGRNVTVEVRDVDGDRVGVVRLRERWGSVEVDAQMWSLTPGFHGFHVHQTGRCAALPGGAPFTAAGGHYAGGNPVHGAHAGDLPSLLVESDGRARLSFTTDRFTLAELRDGDGSAMMVHAGPDNFANIPDRYSTTAGPGPDQATKDTGDSGARAACGVIRPRR